MKYRLEENIWRGNAVSGWETTDTVPVTDDAYREIVVTMDESYDLTERFQGVFDGLGLCNGTVRSGHGLGDTVIQVDNDDYPGAPPSYGFYLIGE